VYHGNNVGHPLYPRTTGQTLTYIMTTRSTSLEPKSQLIINLDPGWECQSLPSENNKKKREKFPIKEWEKAKKRKQSSRSKIERKQKKYAKRSLDQTITEQYRIFTKWTRKRKPRPTMVLSLWLPTKSCVLATFSPRTKQKQKEKAKALKAKIPHLKTIPKISPIDPWSRM